MKSCFAVGAVLCLLTNASAAVVKGVIHRVGARFGPSNCVSVTRSSEGTCVITTECENLDVSQTEFAFDCVGKNNTVRHSFGFGGFDTQEEFDTDLKCDECNSPSPAPIEPTKPVAQPPKYASAKSGVEPVKLTVSVQHASPPQKPKARADATSDVKLTAGVKHGSTPQKPKAHADATSDLKSVELTASAKHGSNTQEHQESKDTQAVPAGKANTSFKIWGASSDEERTKKRKKLVAIPEIVRFGPSGCVSVYKSEESHCIMSTDCKGSDTSNYEYGLVCVDKVGSPVKHLFGQDSFDPVETFDTLIKCNECLGLEDVPDGVALAGEVATLAKTISGLKAAVTNISVNLQMLNKEVFKPTVMPAAAPAPAPAPALAAAASKPTSLLHHSGTHHKHSKKNKKKHLRHSHFRHRHYPVSRHTEERNEDAADDDGWD